MKRILSVVLAIVFCLITLFGCAPKVSPPSSESIKADVKNYFKHEREFVFNSAYESTNNSLEIMEPENATLDGKKYYVDVKVTFTTKYAGFLGAPHGYYKECTISLEYHYSSKSKGWLLENIKEREDTSKMLY
jgi:hypothetical protein